LRLLRFPAVWTVMEVIPAKLRHIPPCEK